MSETTTRHFQSDLEQLKTRLLEMGGLAEDRVRTAVDALVRRDSEAGARVIDGERPIKQLHIEIDKRRFTLPGLHQPKGLGLLGLLSGGKKKTHPGNGGGLLGKKPP